MVGAIYDTTKNEADWLDQLLGTLGPELDHGLGLYGYSFSISGSLTFEPDPIRFRNCSGAVRRFAERALETTNADVIRNVLLAHPAGVTSRVLGLEQWSAARTALPACEARDTIGLSAIDPSGFGCLIVAPTPDVPVAYARRVSRWAKISAHVTAACRLRRRLQRVRRDVLNDADAVYDERGRLKHLRGDDSKERRTRLAEILGAINQARTATDDELARVWTALVDGTWSVVEVIDTDHRRFFVAAKNPPALRPHRRLTTIEVQVATYASVGHSNKLIAYELGLALPTVATHLASATRKLGLRDRLQLIAFIGEVGRRPESDLTDDRVTDSTK